jgi:hypothetical protein
MADTTINMRIEHPIPVGNVDVEYEVRRGPDLLGTLSISKGGLDWRPKGARKPRKATWEQFQAWMKTE